MIKFIFLMFPLLAAGNSYYQTIAKQELLNHGKKAYLRRCASCHGEKGNGLGGASPFLDPKPRDFTSGIFKFRSTSPGMLPTDEDLMRTLQRGVLGTSMPSFKFVPESERFSIVEYIKTFSPAWNKKENIGVAVQGVDFPVEDFRNHDQFILRAKKGRALYIEGCVLCHGKKGHGNGESSQDLVDDWGQKILPADFTKKYIKSGPGAKDIYRVLLTGLDGTPMVSFKDTYTDDQLWDLVAYILYLRGEANNHYDNQTFIKPIAASEIE